MQTFGKLSVPSLFSVLFFSGLFLSAPAANCGAGIAGKVDPGDGASPQGCTVISLVKGEQVFFGGNDDYIEPDSYYWVDPGNEERYGVIWIGRPDNVQQGVNEKGLAYDANGLPRVRVNPHEERLPVEGSYTSYPIHILHSCASVEEVIRWVNTHCWHSYMHDQMHFADRTGDAVIISAGKDGELVFTRKPPGDGFLVSTNFNVANPANGYGYPCERYTRAGMMLEDLAGREGPVSYEDVTEILDAVHMENASSWTIESMVADLSRGIVYLYYFYQYDQPLVLHLEEELAHPGDPGPLSRLFPPEIQQEAGRRYRELQERSSLCRSYGKAWIALVSLSLLVFFVLAWKQVKNRPFWIFAILLSGPPALIFRAFAGRKPPVSSWQKTIVESLGDSMPPAASFLAILVIISLNIWLPQIVHLILFLSVPVLSSWLFLALLRRKKPVHEHPKNNLLAIFPHALVAANLSVGGISLVAIPLVNRSLAFCALLPFSGWTLLVFWAIVAAGSWAAWLILFPYERKRLSRSDPNLSAGTIKPDEVPSRSGLRSWGWILFSYLILFGGMVLGALL